MTETVKEGGQPGVLRQILLEWRLGLDVDLGARAELRRCEGERDAMMCKGLSPLLSRLLAYEQSKGTYARKRDAVILHAARTAFVLSKFNKLKVDVSPARAMSASSNKKPVVSPLRASVLFRSDSESEAARVLAGMASLMGPCDPLFIHFAMGNWEQARREWATDYNLLIHDLYVRKAA